MSGIDLSSLGSLTANIGSLLPSGSQIVENVLVGAAGSVVLKGLQAGGASALDPFGLFANKGVTPANNPNAITGATCTSAALAAMAQADAANKTNLVATFFASGGHVVN